MTTLPSRWLNPCKDGKAHRAVITPPEKGREQVGTCVYCKQKRTYTNQLIEPLAARRPHRRMGVAPIEERYVGFVSWA